ncbi:MAG: lysophospholipid acyltransferase family protein [Bdellovibrionales bacterium]|jgi:lysophospholipid acyltransferase (LPLAT)-like uncharacterized protein|nr:lysophospholipid acyltransferase family protein [Bdellovibrionales bacterium]MBT3526643.1 lysophospholipid acyltransferase family protein [Bdellovibrionales bacterium]MBT7669841.1 lysophospholipid acyltransferase family protein [Bdellovibrionales bacterium]MBT7766250.1 lysophospholipid acyltransferase family protein [Bdellovibrionales bacterium]
MKRLIFILLSYLIYYLIRALAATWRVTHIGQDRRELDRAHILACWHQNALHGIFVQNGVKKYAAMVSRSYDGELVAASLRRLGHHPVRGSSTRGGQEAAGTMLEALLAGIPSAITIDGPKGPVFEVHFGVMSLARQANCPIIPYSVYPEKFWSVNSWDKFRIPKPFTRVFVDYGEPIQIPDGTFKKQYPEYASRLKEALHAGEAKIISELIV